MPGGMRVSRSLDSDSREHEQEQEQEQVLLHVLYLIYRRLHVPLANRSFARKLSKPRCTWKKIK